MTILVQRDGRLYFSAGNLSRLAISGQDIPEPLDVAFKDITSLVALNAGPGGNMLIVNGVPYHNCAPAFKDILLTMKSQGIDIKKVFGDAEGQR